MVTRLGNSINTNPFLWMIWFQKTTSIARWNKVKRPRHYYGISPSFSYQTIYRRYRQWRRTGLLSQVLSLLARDLKTRGGFDLAEAIATGRIKLSGSPRIGNGRKHILEITLDTYQHSTWQLVTALLILGIAARQK